MNDVARLAEQQPDPSREVRVPNEPQSLTRMLPVHRFLRHTACYVLIGLTCLALLLLELRMHLVHAPEYHWMRWNLFLAWVPYAASLWIAALSREQAGAWRRAWLPALLWLLFFPNAPYLVTDLRHLQE